ncbi:YdiU family protein [Corynebacterium sp. HMSC11E11]|uniref:protein adenylyltransferase SelO n=1 Tax=Corynebacterium sp. HMSC11E11 TaxID=1581089 RepID=UPI0009F39E54|nr:protein adenylyltransferase SelO family protein [Corynebacterium sp. HMSC11E11]
MPQTNEPTTAATPPVRLTTDFADTMPEMAIAWAAQESPAPEIVVLNDDLARELGLDAEWLRTPAGVEFLLGRTGVADGDATADGTTPNSTAGNSPTSAPYSPSAPYRPVAQAYSGHQFGHFVPILGDGRALLLGEITDRNGNLRDIHLKGSGPTPFARRGDGLAALGPMLREYLVAEAMHALGIPTTRALAVIATGGRVQRERVLPGAVLVRVASSHLRVGSFQFARAHGGDDVVKRLVDHAAVRHYPHLLDLPEADRPLALFDAVADAQADLVAAWLGAGFVHGVMNTDNVTISGETIDYGPCAFLDAHDPRAVFSSIDGQGIYAFGAQPRVLEWDLARFTETLAPLYDADPDRALALAREHLAGFRGLMDGRIRDVWRAKLGLADGADRADAVAVDAVVEEWLAMLGDDAPDHTLVHRALTLVAAADGRDGDSPDTVEDALLAHFSDYDRAREWLAAWRELSPDAESMRRSNPIYIPRNHLVEEALAAAGAADATQPRDMGPFHALLARITAPYVTSDNPDDERYERPAPAEFGDYTTYCGT